MRDRTLIRQRAVLIVEQHELARGIDARRASCASNSACRPSASDSSGISCASIAASLIASVHNERRTSASPALAA
jgi:hypothetical protein